MNKLLKTSIIAAGVITTIGCITGSVSDDSVCGLQPITFTIPSLPSVPAGDACLGLGDVSIPPLTTTTTIDFASDINKVVDSGIASKLTVGVKSLTIDNSQGDFDWVHSVDVQISTPTLPQVDFATYTMTTATPSQLDINVNMPAETVLQYVESGPVILTITLAADTISACAAEKLATMGGTLNSNIDVCITASATFNKNL
jgi:hypothetical protein